MKYSESRQLFLSRTPPEKGGGGREKRRSGKKPCYSDFNDEQSADEVSLNGRKMSVSIMINLTLRIILLVRMRRRRRRRRRRIWRKKN